VAYEKCATLAPDDPDYWWHWGWSLKRQGRIEDAIEKQRKAIQCDPKYGDAWNSIGRCFEELNRHEEAFTHFRRAAENGSAYGLENVARAYRYGEGVKKDMAKAMEYYERAVEAGRCMGAYKMAKLYVDNRATKDWGIQAVRWYTRAAEQDEVRAMIALANLYRITGGGIASDAKKEFEWLSKAANLGDMTAQYRVGKMYERGRGVKQDYEQAVKWYSASKKQGWANSIRALKRCQKLLKESKGATGATPK